MLCSILKLQPIQLIQRFTQLQFFCFFKNNFISPKGSISLTLGLRMTFSFLGSSAYESIPSEVLPTRTWWNRSAWSLAFFLQPFANLSRNRYYTWHDAGSFWRMLVNFLLQVYDTQIQTLYFHLCSNVHYINSLLRLLQDHYSHGSSTSTHISKVKQVHLRIRDTKKMESETLTWTCEGYSDQKLHLSLSYILIFPFPFFPLHFCTMPQDFLLWCSFAWRKNILLGMKNKP